MMRLVETDEIHGIRYDQMIHKDGFLAHIPAKYRPLCEIIHHVDTQLREERTGILHWRVQGYIFKEDLENLVSNNDVELQGSTIKFTKDKLEIWSLIIQHK